LRRWQVYRYEGKIGIESGLARVEFDAENGLLDLYSGDTLVFAGSSIGVLTRAKKQVEHLETPGAWEPAGKTGATLNFFKREDWGRLLLGIEPVERGAFVLRVGLAWDSDDEPPQIEAIVPVKVPAGGVFPGRTSVRPWRVYVHGWQCWTPTAALKSKRPGDYLLPLFLPRRLKAMLVNPATPVSSDRGVFESEWFAGLADTSTFDSVVVGFTGVSRMLSRVSVRPGRKPEQSELEALALLEGKRPERGTALWAEPLALIPGDLSTANFEHYAMLLAAEQMVEEVKPMPAGWCSWYQYFTGVSRDEVLANADRLCKDFTNLAIDVIQVDDGYSPAVGDWLENNERFPGGMQALARDLDSRGKIPGVWVAPFTVTRKSRVFREKPDWIQRDRKGKPVLAGYNPAWKGRFYGLDLTNPEVLDHLREVFGTLASYGYRFFKLDFMACGLLEGKRSDESLTKAEAARRALEVIRESAGEGAMIIAAGGPVLLGTGILDAQRVSGDVAPYWRTRYQPLLRDRSTPGVRNSLINTMTRAFLSGRVFEGDPDCMLARSKKTRLTEDERRTLASAIAVLGGSFMVSDDTSLWGQEEYALVARSMPHARGLPLCPDLWLREVPMYLVSRMSDLAGDYLLALAVNWFKKTADMKVDLSELGLGRERWHASEFWSGKYLGEFKDSFTLQRVAPHGCGLVRLTRAVDEPCLVGSSLNLAQGAAEIVEFVSEPGGVRMQVRSPLECEAVITLCLPGAGEVSVERDGMGEVKVERLTTSVYRLTFDIEDQAHLEVTYLGNVKEQAPAPEPGRFYEEDEYGPLEHHEEFAALERKEEYALLEGDRESAPGQTGPKPAGTEPAAAEGNKEEGE
jgi:alpha-galactosidase